MKKKQIIPYPEYTTIERDALTNVVVDYKIKNTTTDTFEMWDGVSWIEVFVKVAEAIATAIEADNFSFDLEQANYNKVTFYESETKKEIIEDGTVLPSVEEFDEEWVKTNSVDFSYPHGTVYNNGYMYVATRQMPARLAKINTSDFTDVSIITFPGTTSASLYSWAEDLIYSKQNDKIYLSFCDPDYDSRDLHVIEINPETLAYTTVIDESGIPGGFSKGCAIGNYLYFSTTEGTQRILKYSLTDFSLVNDSLSPIETGSVSASIVYDNNYIFVTEIWGANAKLRRYNLATDLFDAVIQLPTTAMSSNVAIIGDYVYVTTITELDENSSGNGIYKVKIDLSSYETLYSEGLDDNWGMLYDSKYLWSISKTSPARLTRINPITLEANIKTLDVGYNRMNKMSTDGVSLFLTSYESPSNIIKITIPSLFDETLFLGTDNDVLMKIDNVNKKVEFIDIIIDVTHAELLALKNASGLYPGMQYKTSDTVTKYNQPITDIIKTGTLEPLIHTALSSSELSKDVKSALFPQDIIYYDIDDIETEIAGGGYTSINELNTTGDSVSGYEGILGWDKELTSTLWFYYQDPDSDIYAYDTEVARDTHNKTTSPIFSCSQGLPATIVTMNSSGYSGTLSVVTLGNESEWNVEYLSSARTGRITHREDAVTGNATAYDWRNVFFARGKCNQALYVAGTTYAEGDIVRIEGIALYVSVEDVNIGNDPTISPTKWWKLLNLTTTEYWGWETNSNGISFDMTDTIEVPTFWILGEESNTSGLVDATGIHGGTVDGGFRKTTIDEFYGQEIIDAWGEGNLSDYRYCNTVFMFKPDGETEVSLGSIRVGTEPNGEEGIVTGKNTIQLASNSKNARLGFVRNNLGMFVFSNTNVSTFNSNISYLSTNLTKNLLIVDYNKFTSGVVLHTTLLECSSSILGGNIDVNGRIGNIISNGIYKTDGDLYSVNIKDATHLKSNTYHKRVFKDSAGTQKISYIDAGNNIIYALPTD